ncbi:Calcium/calmodulin-dependent protein kinase type IV [Echinococcus granulosus]|uniref:Calcium:calmodulin dependent protein kinase type n=2 Tax=Echinococcus granulosus TaxID=6210 RepID=A0A068WHT6_ECHGR|nr:Calcium/calmodulin-dependent protein kinase type IV [Echinococcus granulosus]CDS18036.1 calcium:calmodulin dependent protein kinase type [Echinococcus granulosus]
MCDRYWFIESEEVRKFEGIYKLKKEIGRRWYQPIGSASFTFHCRDLTNLEWTVKSLQKKTKNYVKSVKLGHLLHLEHKNIVRLREVFESDAYIFMVSEYVEGRPLFEYFACLEELSETLMSSAVKQINRGLMYLHDFGIAHRDLKPNNLLVKKVGENIIVKISDAAFSTVIGMDMEMELVNGDITFTAPEIFLTHKHGPPVDMWALGVLLFIMVSGVEPFKRENEMDSFRAILKGEFSFDGAEWQGISMHCKDLIRRLLVVEPVIRLTAIQTTNHKWISGEETAEHILPEIPYRLESFNQRCKERAEYWKSVKSMLPEDHLERPLVKDASCIALRNCESEHNATLNKLLY